MKKFIISIDQGTTSSRVILFDTKGNIVFVSQYEFKQYFPKNGWVEHNPNEIWSTTLKALKQVINKAKKLKGHILTIGITNQRETTILWNKKTGKPIYNAIVWQDRRTQDYCKLLKKKNYENLFRNKTGLFIDPYFSATKIKWILDNVKISKKLLSSNDLLFGTVDTFLIWKLTKGKQHLTEASNASRTMLYNINNNKWDKEILKKLNIPLKILPEVKNSADNFGKTDKKITGVEISISAVLGDQQAAAFGQTCFEKGSIKSTYGTGAFVIMNTGPKKINSKNKLLTTICYRLNNKNTYALEGSIFIAGAGVQWLRDKVKLIKKAPETEKISKSSKINDGVFVVPAFSGMGAPYWRPDARGVITGLTRDSDWKSIVRATVESVGYQSFDLFDSMNKDGLKPRIVKVDGGMVANNWFTQFLADIINLKVVRPKILETTALGVALLAGLQIGEYKSLNQIKNMWKKDRVFSPNIKKTLRNELLAGWKLAIKKTLA
ncbi:glycerol kinase GlpK [Candidatus Pelagibacter communis]|uniref:glycerol kinase GlpK n=1 Tax=Pelagibacter ubique TaxID=198252 RepID=UPI00065B372A|nr:glycerol kinase GlpK [Candidatus Pelagibacter ubique]